MNKQSEKLAKAIAYEAKKKKERDEDKRPAFHVTPTTGWCNDPNGFSRFGGHQKMSGFELADAFRLDLKGIMTWQCEVITSNS